VQNIEVVIPGSIGAPNGIHTKNSSASECIVIGAHYDTVDVSPGADDNMALFLWKDFLLL